MIFVMGTMTVRDGDVLRLKPAICRQVVATRDEPGCDLYALATDVLDPNVIHVGERWADQPSLGSHLVSDHMVGFNVDLRAVRILSARIDAFHPGGEVRKLIDINATRTRVPQESKDMVIVMGTATFAPGALDTLVEAMRVQLEATRAEDGCEHYSFARDVLDPDTLRIAERWRDNAAIAAHFASPHMAAFNNALAAVEIVGLSVKAYDENGVRTLMGT